MPMDRSGRSGALAVSALVVLALSTTGCGSKDSDDRPRASASATVSAMAPSPTRSPSGTQIVGTHSRLFKEKVVSDSSGFLLYRYDRDSSSASACLDACAEEWPPVLAKGDLVALGGVNRRQLGTIKRPDGSLQVTLDGQPLYRYTGDTQPGQAYGHGYRGLWYVVDLTGEKAQKATGGPSTAHSTPAESYDSNDDDDSDGSSKKRKPGRSGGSKKRR